MEVASFKERKWSCYGGFQFNGENGHVTEVVSLIDRTYHVNFISLMEGE